MTRLLEYHNTEHDYKVLQVKQRMKEENEMLQNEMTRLREVREKSQIGRLRGERPEYETENWWV